MILLYIVYNYLNFPILYDLWVSKEENIVSKHLDMNFYLVKRNEKHLITSRCKLFFSFIGGTL